MDESAEWRLKYDVEVERSTECVKQLNQVHKLVSCAFELLCFYDIFIAQIIGFL
jgi:hypothetical protein